MIKAILFDVDGVLIDTLDGNRKTFNHVLEEIGAKPLSAQEYRRFYFRPARKVFAALLPQKSGQEIEEIINTFLPITSDYFKFDKVNPHVVETLDALKPFRMGVVTNRLNADILDFFHLKGYFQAVVCFSDVKNHKPHPEPVQLALSKLGVRPEESIFIGDAQSDLEAAKGAGVRTAIYRNPDVMGDWNVTDFREIPKIVERQNSA